MSTADNLDGADKGGRPEKDIDLEAFRKLCQLQCTRDEIAGFFGVSTKTIERRLKVEDYKAAWDEGRAAGKISLRRRMWSTANATGAGHGAVQMQIHLSKHWLGMTDRSAVDVKLEGELEVSSATERVKRKLDGIAERIAGRVAGGAEAVCRIC